MRPAREGAAADRQASASPGRLRTYGRDDHLRPRRLRGSPRRHGHRHGSGRVGAGALQEPRALGGGRPAPIGLRQRSIAGGIRPEGGGGHPARPGRRHGAPDITAGGSPGAGGQGRSPGGGGGARFGGPPPGQGTAQCSRDVPGVPWRRPVGVRSWSVPLPARREPVRRRGAGAGQCRVGAWPRAERGPRVLRSPVLCSWPVWPGDISLNVPSSAPPVSGPVRLNGCIGKPCL